MPAESFELFISYSRKDNEPRPGEERGWVTALGEGILEDHRQYSTELLRIFFDTGAIRGMDDWGSRILQGLRTSRVLLVCLSPHYFASEYCRWEWEEYLRRQVHQQMGVESVATVYFVEVPGTGSATTGAQLAAWKEQVFKTQVATDLRPWFPDGPEALRREEVRRRLATP